ncbi:XRE family transcriptional regulator [Wenzhouxiangella sp. EGI_FJ10409]|uniref:XRE family transcriptional regulator n=1 Tax=Wenzhouxiangella sp. EGI_FJ10409 TaxID=3243767 RepID=UPI0035DD4E14
MSNPSGWTNRIIRSDGTVDVDALAGILLATKAELVASVGLSPEDGPDDPQRRSEVAQRRLLALVYILERVAPWTGHPRIAFAWFRSQSLPSFGLMTAEDMLKMGRESAVEGYLDRVTAGGYA